MQHILRTLITILLLTTVALAQNRKATIVGKVVNGNGEPIAEATVYLFKSPFKTETDQEGRYILHVPAGEYQLRTSAVGYVRYNFHLHLRREEIRKLPIVLSVDPKMSLDQVEVVGQSAIQEVRESPFNVVALDAKSQYNSTLDLAHMLGKASGVKIRESGGVGSDININLNGFTGRNIKIFMDGVPMQGFGSAFQLNNIPVSVAERIEVYKGVVPIEFGGDAIGGAINIVTNQTTNTFLDASYSYGSFNTHRTNVIYGQTSDKGFSLQMNAYQNYSDNSYRIKSKVLQENFQYTRDEVWVKRFHDTYHNEAIVGKVGWVNKPWADRFFMGLTLSQEKADIQNSASNIQFVYGARERSGKTILPSLEYYKRNLLIDGLTVRLTGNYNYNTNKNIDTASYRYNWYGQQIASPVQGEVSGVNSLSDYYNSNYSTTANVSYTINQKHALAFSDVLTGSERKLSSNLSEEELPLIQTMRRLNTKNVLGVSYRYRHNRNWNVNVFGKNYHQRVIGPYNEGTEVDIHYVERSASYNTTGYGLATTYFLNDYQLKASIERAYRLPTDNELFGDEVQETANSALKAENSMNYNLGFTLNRALRNKDVVYLDVNGFFRNTQGFIRKIPIQRSGAITNVNHGVVHNIGVDVEGRYYFKNKAMIGGTLTYQDMRNKEGLRDPEGSALSGTYNNRMPNIPYFFGNADAAYYIHGLGGKGNVLNLEYGLNYVGKFYLFWENQGDPSLKKTLPKQLSHNFTATYSLRNGKYNFTLEARNFTNELLYDNFSLMKPGRAFYVKCRYYLMKRK